MRTLRVVIGAEGGETVTGAEGGNAVGRPVELALRVWGPAGAGTSGASRLGDVPPARQFLLVHGLASNARLWDEVATTLVAAGHQAVAVDLRSHGESPATARGYDTTTAADDLAALCRALELTQVIAAGQSWGANVVVRLAARHPDLVGALVLVDGGWLDLSANFASWPECAAALRPSDVDGQPAATLRREISAAHPDWSAGAVDATLASLRQRPDGTVERRLSIDNHLRILRSMWDEPPWADLAQIAVPTVLLPAVPAAGSRRSSAASGSPAGRKRALVERAASLLAQASVREYVGGDHDLHAQQPDQVAADLVRLAAGTDRSGSGLTGSVDHGTAEE